MRIGSFLIIQNYGNRYDNTNFTVFIKLIITSQHGVCDFLL